ncbi:MAG: pilus assembly PilX N-terminal domain-containing protein [Patescibacteria group bacterium]
MNKNLLTNRKGSALLVSILITAVMLVVGLGINRLIVVELRVERSLVQGGEAYYAAEGASELALLDIKANLAGYEASGEEATLDNGASYDYEISALGPVWPCDVYGDKVYDNEGELWRVLEVEESVIVPLFSDDGEDLTHLEDFKLDMTMDAGLPGSLRWKILGINGASRLTEAISDYEDIHGGGFYNWYANSKTAGYYQDLGGSWGGRQYVFIEEYNVSQFLRDHEYNYLILTNLSAGDYDVYVRLTDGDSDFVCEYVGVEADGFNGDFVQQIDTFVKEGEPLPVFDFVLWEKEV